MRERKRERESERAFKICDIVDTSEHPLVP